MERRKCNQAYAKLLIKEQNSSDNEMNENVEQIAFKRTNSVRASLRRLKGKLHAPNVLQSPFTIRGPLSLRSKQIIKRNLKSSDKSYTAKRCSTVLKMYETCEDLSKVALISNDNNKRKSINERERYKIKNKTEILLNKDCGIEQLMSGLPVGPVPRKACKLLQIPETYCLKYLEEQKRVQEQQPQKQYEGSVDCRNNNNNKKNIVDKENSIEYCEKIIREGIYGSTRLRTATIRKPVPYLNSNNVLSNNICDETTEVKLRHQVDDSDTKNSNETFLTKDKIVHCINNNNNNNIIHQHQHNNQKILHLAEIAKVATIHTRSSCPSTDKYSSNMKNFQMPHAITATTARISEKITASSSARKFMKDFHEMPENKTDRNNTKIAEVMITKEKSSNSINAKNAKMSADVENSISTHVHSKGTTTTHNNNNNTNNHNKNNNNNKNNTNISKNYLSVQPITTTTTELTTTTAKVVSRTKGGGNTPHRGKMSKKQLKLAQAQLDKLTQINLHQHALFSAIEHGHLDKARTILESTDIDVNSINSDGLSALDVAVLSNNRSMTRMLLQHGALESSQLTNENIGTKLNNLLKDAESRIHDLSDCLEAPYQPSLSARSSISSIIIGNTSSTVTGCTGNEVDKQIGIWERRVKGLRRMLLGWDQAQPPDSPLSVTVDVTSENTITVQILEPIDGAISTKFKVQWSTRADFGNIVGEYESMEWNCFHGNMGTMCYIGNLTQGRRYYLRAVCGNVKGWGPYKISTPSNIIPSSWKDLNNREDRYTGRQRILDNLFTAVRLARPADVSELTLNSSNVQKRNPKKKTTIKQLFSVASKFQKNLRRGIYLASIIYCEDKVLVTSEDCLPVIEIDDSYPSTLHSDYHWLMKVAFTWDNVKSLRTDMERNLTSTVHFRTKLLAAVCQMQSALGLTDLGQLYYKPIRDSHGTVVLTCIQSVKTQKTISILNSRWLPVNKLQKKVFALLEDYNISEMLIASVADQMKYHQASTQRLGAGLYMGYLKMQCSVEQIQVVVPVSTPNVLPHCKIRNNSHITAEEWQALKRDVSSNQQSTQRRNSSPRGLSFDLSDNNDAEKPSEVQRLFLRDLTAAAHRLLNYMNVKPEDAGTHRLYDIEVIEHSKDISFLVMCPAVELSCAAPGQAEILLQRDDIISLSIQAFEMIHLRTYQPGIIQKYARLSCILELDTALANHSHRQAFSNSELQLAKERLAKLQELTSSLNAVWKSVRWLMDVIAFARDKNTTRSLLFKEILELAPQISADTQMLENTKETQLLQLPVRDVKFNKSGSGRGSWPGPQVSGSTPLDDEHSRSEQNLGRSAITPTTLTAPAFTSNSQKCGFKETQLLNVADYEGVCSRKNSGDSGDSQYTVHSYYSALDSGTELDFNIPASRSDDTLALAALDASKQQCALSQRKRTTSNLVCSTTQPPLITVHSSNSVPYLTRDLVGSSSSLSLRQSVGAMNEHKMDVKNKASSSMNLRDGGLYLKTTLSALQTEIKADLATSTATAASTNAKSNIVKQNSEEDNASSSSSLTATETTTNANAGIIQVYTAYNTGLATGTSLKLHVTPKTSAREVINLVVKQLNMAAVLKGSNGPIYTPDMLDNFCLVAVIGARERCLRDDFKPLQLQNPWKKGRLYVRQKHELLAAIDHSNRKSHLI